MSVYRLAVPLLVTLALLVPALSFARSGGAAPKPPRTPHVASMTRTLRLALPNVSPTVDPALVADEGTMEVAQLMYSGLVRLNARYHVVNDAASKITVSPDHLVYTFYLRHNLHFSNGDPVVAKDFQFAITRSLLPSLRSPSAPTYLLDIKGAHDVLSGKTKTVSGIKVVNQYTLQITARWAIPYFLMELTYPTSYALDARAITRLGSADNTQWYGNPIGSGPYRLKSWAPNVQMVLSRNPYYIGPRPAVSTIKIPLTALAGTGTALYQYVTRNVDVVGLPAYDSGLFHRAGVKETNMLAIAGIYMNLRMKMFANRHMRRALILALARNSIVRKAMGPVVSPFGGYVPPGEQGYDPKLRALPYDSALARRELTLAGYSSSKDFPGTTLYYGVDPTDPAAARLIRRLAVAIAKSWHAVLHINVSTRALTLNTLYAKAQAGNLPLYLSGWSADYPDPHDWLAGQWRTKALNNNVGYSSKQFDTAVETADVTWNPVTRARLYDAAQQTLVQDAAWIPLYIPHRLVYIRPTVRNLMLTGYGVIPRAGNWAEVTVQTSSGAQRRVL